MCKSPAPKMRGKILFQIFIAGNSGKILQIRSTPSLFPANRTLSLLLFYHKKRFLVNPCAPLLPVCTQSAFFYLTDCKNYAIIAVRKTQPGCSAIGSAPTLGACDRLTRRTLKARKISVFLAFSRFSAAVCFDKKLLTTDLTTYGFDRKNRISGCRVTVTHQFWELAQAGSTPVIPTK